VILIKYQFGLNLSVGCIASQVLTPEVSTGQVESILAIVFSAME
jgi:hypothetical protein